MPRNLSEDFITQLNAPTKFLAYFASFEFADMDGTSEIDETVRFWTGYSTIEWDGEDWVGAGNLGSIGSIHQSNTPNAPGMRFALTGIDAAILSTTFNYKYRNRKCELFMVFMNSAFDTVLASYRLFGGRISMPIIDDNATHGSIVIEAENELAELMRPNAIRYTDEHQRRIFPTDTGLRYIASVANRRILWGREQFMEIAGGAGRGGSGGTVLPTTPGDTGGIGGQFPYTPPIPPMPGPGNEVLE